MRFREKWLFAIPFSLTALLIFNMEIDAALFALALGLVIMLPVAVTSQATLARTLVVLAIIGAAFTVSRAVIPGDGTVEFDYTSLAAVIAAGTAIFAVILAIIVCRVKAFAKISVKAYRVGAVIVTLLALGAAVVCIRFFGGEQTGMIYEASELLHGRWNDASGNRRIYICRNVIENIRLENLPFGTGPDTLGFWPIEPFTRHVPELGMTLVTPIDAAHNEYLHILATGGTLSLLPYVFALVIVAVQWFLSPDNALSAIAGAGVLFYCRQAFFGISMFITAPFFWMCLAVLIYSQKPPSDEKVKVDVLKRVK